ncbi:choice-of-anchor D domain-containing protein [Candidatus Albibeggiatoa sp. nov. NOAA]|uniref:choice-of-anchor D domain-containing protein n=1 Tax=Candidatus Albibeggiatoa sp. nov. NOAA TaxID=3162724 RepID=UPI0032FE9DE7|nr:choice-of-anchor D domain-containing protein [Thiotrichaceae bacterium]
MIIRFLWLIKKILPFIAAILITTLFQSHAAATAYSFVADQFVNGICTTTGSSVVPVHSDPFYYYFAGRIDNNDGSYHCDIDVDGFASKFGVGSTAYGKFVVTTSDEVNNTISIFGFDVKNTTGSSKTLSIAFKRNGSTLSTQSHSVANGTSSVILSPSVSTADTVEINFPTTDSMAFNNFVLGTSEGLPSVPEIDVQGNSTSISDGDTSPATADNTDFGTVTIGNTVTKTYAIKNTGTAALILSGNPKVALSGAGCTEFSVGTQPSSPLAIAGSRNFSITYTPTAVTTSNCTVSIANDDSNENPYNFAITGLGQKIAQTITFGTLTDKIYGDPDFSVSATASSGLAPTFTTSGQCSNTGSTISIDYVGSCTVTASQAGNATYYAATDVSHTFTIDKIAQTITFNALSDKDYDDPDFSVSATASSSLAPTFTTSGTCSNTGSTISIDDVGNCTVTASQSGSDIYHAATDVSQTFYIDKASQIISLNPSSTGIVGNNTTLSPTGGNSGNPITLATTTSKTCSLNGNILNYLNAGTCTITANQAGNSQYYAANEVIKNITITKASTSTNFRTVSPTPSAIGQEVYIGFEVTSETGTTPTGEVTISSGDYNCNRTITSSHNGSSGCFIAFEEEGEYDFAITYSGDDNHFLSGNNKGLSHQVSQANIIYTPQETALSETEGSTVYTIQLATIPASVVNLIITPDEQLSINDANVGESVSLQLLDVTPVEVTVNVNDDDILEGEHLGLITHTSNSDDSNYDAKDAELSFSITDNDAGVVITQTDGVSEIIEAGEADTYKIKLNTEPTEDVIINIETDSDQISIYPSNLIFTRLNWKYTQTVRLLAVDDLDVEGNATAAVTHNITTQDAIYSAEDVEFIIDEKIGNNISVSIIDNDIAQAPLAPSHLIATLANNQIQLAWQDNSYNENQFILLKNQQMLAQLVTDSVSYIDNPQCGTSYNYQVYATNETDDSPLSNLVTIDYPCPEPLKAPLNFTAQSDIDSQIQLNWQDNNQIEVGYQISRNGHIIHNTAQNVTNYIDKNLSCDIAYQYQIRAIAADLTVSLPAQASTTIRCETEEISPVPEQQPDIEQPQTSIPLIPLEPPIVTSIKDNSTLERNANIGGLTVTNINIQQGASVANGTLAGQITNDGLASNIVLAEGAIMVGGSLSGINTNHGMMQNVTVTLHSEVSGGQFSGSITNHGTMSNFELSTGATLQGGKVSGLIQCHGKILNVQLQANTHILGGQIGGEIKGTASQPAYLGDIEILDGAKLSHVRISPTTKLPDNVTIGEGVIFPKSFTRPDLADFGIDEASLNTIDSDTFQAIEPAAFSVFKPQHIQQLSIETFNQFEAQDIAYLQPETVETIEVEQFEQLPVEALEGFTSSNVDALNQEVLESFTPETLAAIQPEAIQQAEQAGQIFTKLDNKKITPKQVQDYLPEGWQIDLDTGKITAPVGTKLNYKDLVPDNTPSQQRAQLPEIVDLSTSFSLGGDTGESAQDSLNAGIKQTVSIGDVDLNQFIFTQNENGVLNIIGTGLYEGITFAFLPDVNDIEQAPLDVPVGLTQDEGGFFTMITPDQQRFHLTPSSNNPAGLVEVISNQPVDTEKTDYKGQACEFDDQVAKFNEDGDVFLSISPDKTRRRTRAFETDIHMAAMFDAFVEPAPDEFCIDEECNWGEMPDNLQQGMHLPTNLRALQQAYVVYPDGSSQIVYPTVLYPNRLKILLEEIEGVKKVLYQADGSFKVTYFEQTVLLYPTFDTVAAPLPNPYAEVKPSIEYLKTGQLSYSVQDCSRLVTTPLSIEFLP